MHSVDKRKSFIFEVGNLSEEVIVLLGSTIVQLINENTQYMEFSPNNKIIQRCLQAMAMEEKGQMEEANILSLQAWSEATDGFEKFTAAYFVARYQKAVTDRLQWLRTALQFALSVNEDWGRAGLSTLYSKVAECYAELGDTENEDKNRAMASDFKGRIYDQGPFYHGTKASLQIGDLLTPGGGSNYKSNLIMNHIYFTALINGAGLAAALAKGEGAQHVYIVVPTGSFENDPNVTDKKFPGNPTRSYRSLEPLRVIGEVAEWERVASQEVQQWNKKLSGNKGEIIN